MIILFVFAILGTGVNAGGGVAPLVQLNNGHNIPGLGLGTWLGFALKEFTQAQYDEVENAASWAIDAGYRHIDTAAIYSTETQVGQAVTKKIKEGVVKREDLFITTKLWNDQHAKDKVVPALKKSLANLQLEYVDLYLIHWPMATFTNRSLENIDYLETWRGMIEARNQGLTKSIGVSNFNQQQLERIIAETGVKPATLQVEMNLNLQQPSLLSYCRQNQIVVVGYTPFGSLFPSKATAQAPPPRIDDEQLGAIATKYNKTVPQIALRYLVELGVVPIPKSVSKARIEQNLAVFDFKLTSDERQLLSSYDKNYRTIDVKFWSDSPYYPFKKA